MNRMVVKSKVDGAGILHLELTVGVDEANKEVQVTVEPVRPTMTQKEWQAYILATAGSITDPTFERPPQPPLEKREPLS